MQESPLIQPRRNHRDRAWSMLPVLQAFMYWLWKSGMHTQSLRTVKPPQTDRGTFPRCHDYRIVAVMDRR